MKLAVNLTVKLTEILKDILRPAQVLLIVPPFAWHDRPSLGVHLIQALCRSQGVEAQVFYANLFFASAFGERTYQALARMQYGMLLGERLFARAAFGLPALGRNAQARLAPILAALRARYQQNQPSGLTLERLYALEAELGPWIESFVGPVLEVGYRVVGCSTSFEQTCASLAILRRVKERAPQTVTILGGANCEGEMADGLSPVAPMVDHFFAGESEASFLRFLQGFAQGGDHGDGHGEVEEMERIFRGAPWEAMDQLPTPDYADYYAQLNHFVPDGEVAQKGPCYLPYESSRGCWWGQKSHCTFCGLNGQGMRFRAKSKERVLAELRQLCAAHPTPQVAFTDNIMPHDYFRTLLPQLPKELPGLQLMYEEKANLSLRQICLLRDAGVTEIQPGIEALSTGLLRLMAKGTTAAQNIALLRYAQSVGMALQWNLLYGFPLDQRSFYVETLELLPLLRHLPPPKRTNPVIIDRFSPYHSDPTRYQVSELRPLASYEDIFPSGSMVSRIAYHFEGQFPSESLADPQLLQRLSQEVATWRKSYYSQTPAVLWVTALSDGSYELLDTRGLADQAQRYQLSQRELEVLLKPQGAGAERAVIDWGLEHKLLVERDRRLIPLVTGSAELLLRMESALALVT